MLGIGRPPPPVTPELPTRQDLEKYIDEKLANEREINALRVEKSVEDELKKHVDAKFSSEKELIISYLGMGLKIALGSVVVSLLIFGFFGWKSYDDISKVIKAEIKSRFTDDNPVKKYDAMLRDAAVSAIVDGMSAKLQRPSVERFRKSSDNTDNLQFLAKYLQEPEPNIDIVLEILNISTLLSQDEKKIIARLSRKFLIYDFRGEIEKQLNIISKIAVLYTEADISVYTDDIISIIDKYKENKSIIRPISKALLNFNQDAVARLAERLAQIKDPVIKIDLAMLSILRGSARAEDINIIKDEISASARVQARSGIFEFNRREGYSPSDLILQMSKFNQRLDELWILASHFADAYSAVKSEVIYDSYDSFNYDRQLVTKIQILMNGVGYVMDYGNYIRFCRTLGSAFLSKSNFFASPNANDIKIMKYFIPKSRKDVFDDAEETSIDRQDHLMLFAYNGRAIVADQTGLEIARNRHSDTLYIKLENHISGAPLSLFWRDATGETQTVGATSIKNLDRGRTILVNLSKIL